MKRLLIIAAVMVPLLTAAAISDGRNDTVPGALILFAGVVLISYRTELSAIMVAIAKNPSVAGTTLEDAKQTRPFTMILFGAALCIVGLAWLAQGYLHP